LLAVRRLADDLQVVGAIEQACQSRPDKLVIIC